MRKVLAIEAVPVDEIHPVLTHAMATGAPLQLAAHTAWPEIVRAVQAVMARLVDDIHDPEELATHLATVIPNSNPGELADELAMYPLGADTATQEDEEAIETAPALSRPWP